MPTLIRLRNVVTEVAAPSNKAWSPRYFRNLFLFLPRSKPRFTHRLVLINTFALQVFYNRKKKQIQVVMYLGLQQSFHRLKGIRWCDSPFLKFRVSIILLLLPQYSYISDTSIVVIDISNDYSFLAFWKCFCCILYSQSIATPLQMLFSIHLYPHVLLWPYSNALHIICLRFAFSKYL